MFESLNNFLLKMPVARDLTIIILFGLSWYQTTETNKVIEKNSYQYEYHLLAYSLAEVNSNAEISTMVRKWQNDGWGAQIAAAQVICNSPARERIVNLIGNTGASTLCRISH